MSKLTAKEIDDRSVRAMGAYLRALERGDIDQKTYDEGVKELAAWAVAQYMRLPRDKGIEALMGMLLDLQGGPQIDYDK